MSRIITSMQVTPTPNFFHALIKSVSGNEILKGDQIKQFENSFAKYVGVKHAIAVSSGRFAMELILKSLNLRKNSEIIMTSYSFNELPKIIKRMGFKPVFVDIEDKTFNMNCQEIEKKITKNTRAIIATHLFGLPCDMNEIMKISPKYNIHVIEDCAHAVGAEINKHRVGSIGVAGFFSFGITKQINTLGGGMITTNDNFLAQRIRKEISSNKFSMTNLIKKIFLGYASSLALNSSLNSLAIRLYYNKQIKEMIEKVYTNTRGFQEERKMRFTNFQAALGLKQLKNIDNTNRKKLKNAFLYMRLLKKVSKINIHADLKGKRHSFSNFVITTEWNALNLSKFLLKKGIDAQSDEYIMQNCTGENISLYPSTEKIMRSALKLPINGNLINEKIRYIVKNINEYGKKQ